LGYIFYDTETTGLDAGFGQILQFAALVTDDDLNVVEEVNLRCRLQPHVLPTPGALVITGIRPFEIEQAPLSHYEMIRAIRALIERNAPTTMGGFNSLGYDEAMLRQAFYQTLHPVYLTNTGGNTRMDMLRVAHAISQYAPDVLAVPTTAEGRPTFKLALLAAANGLLHDHAHDALSDTLATLELARLVRNKAPAVWDAMRQMRSKQAAGDFIARNDLFWFTDMAFGTPTILAAKIATNPDNPSEVALFDLGHDPSPYLDMTCESVQGLFKASPRLVRIVKLNSQPILMPLSMVPACGGDFDIELARQRSQMIADHPTFREAVAKSLALRYPERAPATYVEERIYEGFPSRADADLMERFHSLPWPERPTVAARLADERIRELGERLIYLEAPEALPDDVRSKYDGWRRSRLTSDTTAPWFGLAAAWEDLTRQRAKAGEENGEQLAEIEGYLNRVSQELADASRSAGQSRFVWLPGDVTVSSAERSGTEDGTSNEMFYLDENGQKQDRELCEELLGDDMMDPILDFSDPEVVAYWKRVWAEEPPEGE
jgi:exodeoxyribonuclease-1